jgi:hypothetical protein
VPVYGSKGRFAPHGGCFAILDSLKQARIASVGARPVQASQGARSAPLAGCLEAFELAIYNLEEFLREQNDHQKRSKAALLRTTTRGR